MDLGLAGRRAFVPAASAGLGFAVADALAGEGVRVALCGRDAGRIESAAQRIGAGAHPIVGDVASTAGALGAAEEAVEALGGEIDILILNGPGPPPGTFATTSDERYPEALEAGLLPPIALCNRLVGPMCERGWGRVVAITSISVRQPIANLILSSTARSGLTGFLKTLALEVAARGVTVNSLQPGLHETERVRSLYGDHVAEVGKEVPAGTIGQAADFGRVAAFLCSEHARYVTGTAIPVDGGAYRALL